MGVSGLEIVVMKRGMVDGGSVVYSFAPTSLSRSLDCVCFDRGFALPEGL